MKIVELSDGDYAAHWGLTDFYDEAKHRLLLALNSPEEFTTGWFGCKKEIEYAKIERIGNEIIISVSCHMDDLVESDALIYDAIWTVHKIEEQLPDDVIDSIRESAIALGIEDYTQEAKTLPRNASFKDIVSCIDLLSERANANNDQMYHQLCEIVKHIDAIRRR